MTRQTGADPEAVASAFARLYRELEETPDKAKVRVAAVEQASREAEVAEGALGEWDRFLCGQKDLIAPLGAVGLLQQALAQPQGGAVFQAAERWLHEQGPPEQPYWRCLFGPWRSDTPQPRQVLEGHKGGVVALLPHPDGQRLISGGGDDDGKVRVWDLTEGRCDQVITTRHEGQVRTLVLDGQGRLVTTSENGDPRAIVWDLGAGKRVVTLNGKEGDAVRAFPVPEGALLTTDGKLRRWQPDQARKRLRWTVERPPDALGIGFDLAVVSHDGIELWTLRVDDERQGTIDVRSTQDGSELRTVPLEHRFEREVELTGTLRLHPDGRRLLWGSAEGDGTICVWDGASGRTLERLEGHQGSITDLRVVAGGERLLSASSDRTVRIWDLASGGCLGVCPIQGALPLSTTFSLDEQTLIVGCDDGGIRLWDAGQAFIAPDELPLLQEAFEAIRIPGTNDAAVLFLDTTLRRFEGDRAQLGALWPDTLAPEKKRSVRLAASPDGRWLAVAQSDFSGRGSGPRLRSYRARIFLFEVRTGRCQRAFDGLGSHHEPIVSTIAFTVDGRELLASDCAWSGGSLLYAYETETGKLRRTPGEQKGEAWWVLVPLAGGEMVISADEDGRVAGCETETLQAVWKSERTRPQDIPLPAETSVALLGDRAHFATLSRERALRIWRAGDGHLSKRIAMDRSGPWDTPLSDPGPRVSLVYAESLGLIAGSVDDALVRVWDLESGSLLRALEGHRGYIRDLSYEPETERLLSAGTDGVVRVWSLSSGQPLGSIQLPASAERCLWLTADRFMVLDRGRQLYCFAAG